MTEMPPYLDSNNEEKDSETVESDTSADINDWELPLSYDELRHREPIKGEERVEHSWRLKEKYKTHCVALVLCLNIGVDPPDVVKTQPCARQECWIDPNSMSPIKALESIGHALQTQYERWQPRARYKQSLDPTSDDVKKLCCSLRRNAKDERVLFHYNGHGVPRPTSQGEIWVFNRAFTQYIPLSMYDLQTWMGAPSLYVYDCSHAGVIVDNFKGFAEQHERDYEKQVSSALAAGGAAPPPPVSYRHCLQLGACAAGQALPMNPELPADLFTACLTTPVKMAVKWFVMRARTRVAPSHLHELIDKIPGQVTDRRTMLGELNWIFTAITDSIAWNSLPPELFQQLFRADLLTASLCRNYLLADRIMRSYNCTPVSSPALPSLARHPLWAAWDHTLDLALAQLPLMLSEQRPYQHSPFFRDQLTAFRVWLDRGSAGRAPPDQLPMVLQVLLSTVHRVRALRLLSRFLALGAWAVRQLLRVGIFPYMLKLLQASAPDLRTDMVYIWHKIIAVDPSCQEDLVNAKGHKYFLAVLQDPSVDSEHRTMAAFVLAGVVDNYPAGQDAALQGSMISVCLEQLQADASPALLQWTCVALGRLWRGHHDARWAAARDLAHEKIAPLMAHRQPEVRAACAFALGTFMSAGAGRARTDHANALDQQVALQLAQRAPLDASPLVRQEILAALQWLVLSFEQHFIAASAQDRARRSDRAEGSGARGAVEAGQEALPGAARRVRKAPSSTNIAALALPTIGPASVHMKVWWILTALAQDPHPATAGMARDILTYVAGQLDSVGRDFELVRSSGSGGSLSLPPSPGAHAHALPQGHRRGKSQHGAIAEHSPQRERDSSCSSVETMKKAIVSTQFVEWSASVFSRGTEPSPAPDPMDRVDRPADRMDRPADRMDRPVDRMDRHVDRMDRPVDRVDRAVDRLSRAHLERVWRYERNAQLRRQARALRSARVSRLESQAFHSRCALPPAAVLFHPYEQHIAVASKDNFGVWDWGTGARLLAGAWRRGCGRITSLAYLNAHEHALLAVASHAGHVALYRHEQTPLSAWRALTPAAAPEPPPAAPSPAPAAYGAPPPPVLLAWRARGRSLAVAGNAPLVRLWDAKSELVAREIATCTSAAVTSLWRGDGGGADALVVCGFADGSLRVWDERAPDCTAAHAPLSHAHDHSAPLLLAALRETERQLLTACTSGCVRVYDMRVTSPLRPLHALQAPGPLAAAAAHPLCSLVACGSVNQLISLWDLRELQLQGGGALQTIKFHEGFMGARIGPVACLAFHPLRCALAVGAKDSTVSVYVTEPRR